MARVASIDPRIGLEGLGGAPLHTLAYANQGGPGGFAQVQRNMVGVESGGNYHALGPVTRNGDRAYGKYQVMGRNVPAWTREILGRAMTPEEFLADRDAQEAVFRAKMEEYYRRYGNWEDAASMWFTGRPYAQGRNLSDRYLTDEQYVRRATAGLSSSPPPAPDLATGGDWRA